MTCKPKGCHWNLQIVTN